MNNQTFTRTIHHYTGLHIPYVPDLFSSELLGLVEGLSKSNASASEVDTIIDKTLTSLIHRDLNVISLIDAGEVYRQAINLLENSKDYECTLRRAKTLACVKLQSQKEFLNKETATPFFSVAKEIVESVPSTCLSHPTVVANARLHERTLLEALQSLCRDMVCHIANEIVVTFNNVSCGIHHIQSVFGVKKSNLDMALEVMSWKMRVFFLFLPQEVIDNAISRAHNYYACDEMNNTEQERAFCLKQCLYLEVESLNSSRWAIIKNEYSASMSLETVSLTAVAHLHSIMKRRYHLVVGNSDGDSDNIIPNWDAAYRAVTSLMPNAFCRDLGNDIDPEKRVKFIEDVLLDKVALSMAEYAYEAIA